MYFQLLLLRSQLTIVKDMGEKIQEENVVWGKNINLFWFKIIKQIYLILGQLEVFKWIKKFNLVRFFLLLIKLTIFNKVHWSKLNLLGLWREQVFLRM